MMYDEFSFKAQAVLWRVVAMLDLVRERMKLNKELQPSSHEICEVIAKLFNVTVVDGYQGSDANSWCRLDDGTVLVADVAGDKIVAYLDRNGPWYREETVEYEREDYVVEKLCALMKQVPHGIVKY